MADTTFNFQCPHCTAPLTYDPGAEKITCDYCGSSFTVEELEAYYKEKERKAAKEREAEEQKWKETLSEKEWTEEEKSHLQAFRCSSCGAEIVTDENTMATECCYCGNPVLLASRYDVNLALRPDFVIPFQKTKEEAQEKLREFYKGKILLPKEFATDARIEAIQGMYVPLWLFDSTISSKGFYRGTIRNSFPAGNMLVTETEHYRITRVANMAFSKVPVDGSKRMEDVWMESIGPFDYEKIKPFNPSYLAGYLADKYDVTWEEALPRADALISKTAIKLLENTIQGYSTLAQEEGRVEKEDSALHYALSPVWILTTRYKDRPYTFMMNGQSGKFVGMLPIDEKKCMAYTALSFLVLLPILTFIVQLILKWLDI